MPPSAGTLGELQYQYSLERTKEKQKRLRLHVKTVVKRRAAPLLLKRVVPHRRGAEGCSRRRFRSDDRTHPIVQRMDGALFALSKYRRTNEIVNRNAAAGMPSRSEGRGGLFKVPRSGFLMNFREAHRSIMSAPRKSLRYALRAAFEQTAPPSLREGTPPDSDGDWSAALHQLHRTHSIQTFSGRYFAASRPFCLGHVVRSGSPARLEVDHFSIVIINKDLRVPAPIHNDVQLGLDFLGQELASQGLSHRLER